MLGVGCVSVGKWFETRQIEMSSLASAPCRDTTKKIPMKRAAYLDSRFFVVGVCRLPLALGAARGGQGKKASFASKNASRRRGACTLDRFKTSGVRLGRR